MDDGRLPLANDDGTTLKTASRQQQASCLRLVRIYISMKKKFIFLSGSTFLLPNFCLSTYLSVDTCVESMLRTYEGVLSNLPFTGLLSFLFRFQNLILTLKEKTLEYGDLMTLKNNNFESGF